MTQLPAALEIEVQSSKQLCVAFVTHVPFDVCVLEQTTIHQHAEGSESHLEVFWHVCFGCFVQEWHYMRQMGREMSGSRADVDRIEIGVFAEHVIPVCLGSESP